MGSILPEIRFGEIVARKGSKRAAFEDLAVQAFSINFGDSMKIARVHGDGGDGGIEAYWVTKRRRAAGLQAKYLFTLKGKKPQLEKSLRAALKTFPDLCEYVFVLPFDRTPKQIATWNGWVSGWKRMAKQSGNSRVKIQWCGASNLSTLLHNPAAEGLVRYYFGYPSFNDEWLQLNLDKAVKQLDTRYTPDINIETTAADKLFAFAGMSEFRDIYYKAAGELCEASRRFWSEFPAKPRDKAAKHDEEVRRISRELSEVWPKMFEQLGDGKSLPNFDNIRNSSSRIDEPLERLIRRLGSLDYEENPKREPYEHGSWTFRYNYAQNFQNALRKFGWFLEQYHYWGGNFLLLTGEAGSGKSHLVADIAKKHLSRGSPCILLLGETFGAANDLWEQVAQRLEWTDTVDALLALLEAKAAGSETLGLIIVDAINESDDRRLWQKRASGFSSRLIPYPSLRLIVSCRSDFVNICLPDSISQARERGWTKLEHRGFDINMFKAVEEYFRKYQVKSDHFPPYLPEFSNPLFLKTLCEVYKDRRLPAGPLALSEIFREHKRRIQTDVSMKLDRDEMVVAQAIDLIIQEMVKQKRSRIQAAPVKQALNALIPGTEVSKSLYAHLRSSGLFFEIGDPNEPDGEIRFSFERFYDFFVAEKIVSGFRSVDAAVAAFRPGGMLEGFLDNYAVIYENSGLVGAFSILFPERFGVEFAGLSASPAEPLMRAFIESLKWRKAESITGSAETLIWKFNKHFCLGIFYDLVLLAAVPGHPFNADWTHRFLKSKPMPKREASWTWTVSTCTEKEEEFEPNRFLRWAQNVPVSSVSAEQARLAATMLGWFFACTRVQFRDDATRAAIRILAPHPKATCQFVETLGDVDDPYIRERVYAVAAGVALRCPDKPGLRMLAQTVYDRIFRAGSPPPHILLRDYARTVLEKAFQWQALPSDIDPRRFRPPYKSEWPRIRVSDELIQAKAKKKTYENLCHSLRLTKEYGHKNFGTHMEYAVRHFSNVSLEQPSPRRDRRSKTEFDARIAKRYIFQRVHELGWKPNRFEDEYEIFEDKRPSIETLRKKYQWIALHELQAFLSDRYHFNRDWTNPPSVYEGPWQTSDDDFDPSSSPEFEKEEGNPPPNCWWFAYPDPLLNHSGHSDIDWLFDQNVFDLLPLLNIRQRSKNRSWLALAGYSFWKEPTPYDKDRWNYSEKHAWMHIRSWLVKAIERDQFIGRMKATHFHGNGIMLDHSYDGWLGDYPWGKAHSWATEACAARPCDWLQGDTTPVIATACQITEKSFLVASPQTLALLDGHWSGKGLEYADRSGNTVAFNPSALESGPECILVDFERFLKSIRAARLSLVWTVVGERRFLGGMSVSDFLGAFEFSGVYWIEHGKVVGGITHRKRLEPRKRG